MADKAISAAVGAESGAFVGAIASGGNPVAIGVGALAGAAAGVYYGDQPIVFQEPMICIPAREQYRLASDPSYIIYAHSGESIQPTGIIDDNNRVGMAEATVLSSVLSEIKPKKKSNPYTRFNKRFKFRAKRKNETGMNYMKARNKAVSAAWRKQ